MIETIREQKQTYLNNIKVHNEIFKNYNNFFSKLNFKKKNEVLKKIYEAWMYLNQFRNLDLGFLYDEKINLILKKLNKKKFKKREINKKIRLAWVLDKFNETGGVSWPHKLIFEKEILNKNNIDQYIFFYNTRDLNTKYLFKNESYKYLIKYCPTKKIDLINKKLNFLQRAKAIEKWLIKNKIDIAIVKSHPSSLFACVSNPVNVLATYSPDWHCYTLGPGIGDFNLAISSNQLYDYKYHYSDSEVINIGLSAPSIDLIKRSKKMSLKFLGIKKNSIVSATSNLWKCTFGENKFFLECITKLIRKNMNYHHIFFGSERNLNFLQNYISKNQDIKNNIHFIPHIKNVYSLFKSIDFYINSYPVSGSSNVEAAMCNKPCINFVSFSRRLSGHGPEMLNVPECEVSSESQFHILGNKLIKNKTFRKKLGDDAFLMVRRIQNKSKNSQKLINILKNKLVQDAEQGLTRIKDTCDIILFEKNKLFFENLNLIKKKKLIEFFLKKFKTQDYFYLQNIKLLANSNNDKKIFDFLKKIPDSKFKTYPLKIFKLILYLDQKKYSHAKKLFINLNKHQLTRGQFFEIKKEFTKLLERLNNNKFIKKKRLINRIELKKIFTRIARKI